MDKERVLLFYLGTRKLAAIAGEIYDGHTKVVSHAVIDDPDGFRNGFASHIDQAANSLSRIWFHLCQNPAIKVYAEEYEANCHIILGNSKLKTYTFSSSHYFQGQPRSVSHQDISQVIEQTKSVATLPLTEFVLQSVPVSFMVNDLEGVSDPVGMEAQRLGVTLKIFTMDFHEFKNITKAFESADFEVQGYFPRMLASSEAVLTEKERSEGALMLDIGSDVSYFVLWRGGELISSKALELGSAELVKSVAQHWQIDLPDAESLVYNYGTLTESINFSEELIPLVMRDNKQTRQIERADFHQPFYRMAKEWMKDILSQADYFVQEAHLFYPHYVITGRSVQMDGFAEFMQAALGRDIRIGYPQVQDAPQELRLDSTIGPLLGIFSWLVSESVQEQRVASSKNILQRSVESAKSWLNTYF